MTFREQLKFIGAGYIFITAMAAIAFIGIFAIIDSSSLPSCVSYDGPVTGFDYNGATDTWTDGDQLVGYAVEEDTTIWNHPTCLEGK
jgi:hypothetical protein